MTDESVFAAALAISSPAERGAFLDRVCAGNPPLRKEVEALLAAHAADNPLDRPPAELARTGAYLPEDGPPPAAVGDRFGPYRLMEQIGEGGFGLVFVAEQSEPVRRKVALKVLKPGMDTRDVVARFEAERQALALMDHPNIAKVFDAGSTPQGRPFFVMELVRGVPITDFCDAQKLPPRARLALFVQVCQAVQHAHQKGVIHRDLKPSNVLVTVVDGAPVPKVIDFGVAKAVGQQLTERTIYTRFAQMIGTPLYMSPEQAEMSGVDVDTRSDVYALGVLLYELLTGTTPFDRDRFRKAAFDEIRRIIREEEPPRPSTRLTALRETLTAVSANRGTDAGKLAGLVRGELDWIVMKSLEKDRERRYETANAFAADVQHYLVGEPVAAVPTSAGYRLRKFVRRNRGPVGAALAVLTTLFLGIAGTTAGLMWAIRERDRKDQALQAESISLARAVEAGEEQLKAAMLAERRLKQIDANNRLLTSIFHDLDPNGEREGKPELRVQLAERLDQVANAVLDSGASGDERTTARLQCALGSSLRELGHLERAIALLERALQTQRDQLGESHAETLSTMNDLAVAYYHARRHDEAEQLYLSVIRRHEADGHRNYPTALTAKNNLASLYLSRRTFDRAEALLLEVMQARSATLGIDHLDTLQTMHELAALDRARDRHDAARSRLKEILRLASGKYPPDAPFVLTARNNLAGCYRNLKHLEEARTIYEDVLRERVRQLGPNHPSTLTTKNNLGLTYRDMKRLDLAQPILEDVLRIRVVVLGATHPDSLTSSNTLGLVFFDQQQFERAEPYFRTAYSGRREQLGLGNPATRTALGNLRACYERLNQPERAEPLYRDMAESWKQELGTQSSQYTGELAALASNLIKQRKWVDAELPLRECLTTRQQREPASWVTFDTQSQLGEVLYQLRHYREAEPFLQQGYQGLKERETGLPAGLRHQRLDQALDRLIALYTARNDSAELDKWRAERAKYPEVAPLPRPAKP